MGIINETYICTIKVDRRQSILNNLFMGFEIIKYSFKSNHFLDEIEPDCMGEINLNKKSGLDTVPVLIDQFQLDIPKKDWLISKVKSFIFL